MNIIMSVINGQKTASDLPVFEKRYPATGEVIAHIQPATPQMLDEAVRHAQAAQREWAHMAAHDRARILGRIAGALHQHNEELSALEVQDVGKVYAEAVSADVPSGAEAFEFFASLCATYHGTLIAGQMLLVIPSVCLWASVPVSGPGIIRFRWPAGKLPRRWPPEMPLS